jgi:hypothetical protein
VAIFQQWKHWHAGEIDKAVRHTVGEFNQLVLLASIELIRKEMFNAYRRHEVSLLAMWLYSLSDSTGPLPDPVDETVVSV